MDNDAGQCLDWSGVLSEEDEDCKELSADFTAPVVSEIGVRIAPENVTPGRLAHAGIKLVAKTERAAPLTDYWTKLKLTCNYVDIMAHKEVYVVKVEKNRGWGVSKDIKQAEAEDEEEEEVIDEGLGDYGGMVNVSDLGREVKLGGILDDV